MLTVQFNVALQPQTETTGLNRVREPRTATSTFTQLLSFEEVLQVNMLLNVHRNHEAYYGRGRGVKVNIVLSVHRNHKAY